jgi:hypothetical protein
VEGSSVNGKEGKAESICLRRETHEEHCFRLHFITPGQVAGQEKKTEKRKEKKGYDNNVTISHAAVSSL